MSEAWDEIIGSTEKPEKKLTQPFKAKLNYAHESEEQTAKRRAKSLEAIFTVMPNAEFLEDGMLVRAEVFNRRIDFWPASDCYFLYSRNKYGHGIPELCATIMKHLLEQERKHAV